MAPAASEVDWKRTLLSPVALAAPLVLVTVPQAAGAKAKLVLARVKPAGKVSSTWTVVMAPGLAAGLVRLRVSEALPPAVMLAGLKLLATVGAVYTLVVELAAAALLPALVVKAPAARVLVLAPAVLEVTLMMMVQPPAGMLVALATVMLLAPAVAVTPVQVPLLPAVLRVMPLGKVSVRTALKVMATALLLPRVMVRLVLPPAAIAAAALVLVSVGAFSAVIVRDALAAVPLVATGPVAVGAAVVLVMVPTVVEVTVTPT